MSRVVLYGGLVSVLGLAGLVLLRWFLEPTASERQEIYQGVYYQCLELDDGSGGRVMVVEVHWDEPGVDVVLRPFLPSGGGQYHYKLKPAGMIMSEFELQVLMNGTLYEPADWMHSMPGMQVDSRETVVSYGRVSHVDPQSYLIWWDEEMNAHCEEQKPPSAEALSRAYLGVGVQGLQLRAGHVDYLSLDSMDRVMRRSFLGVNPDKKILWLMSGDALSGRAMAELAQSLGVVYGGQVDGEGAATLVIGNGADGVFPFTGLRGGRPLGNTIGIRAKPLEGG